MDILGAGRAAERWDQMLLLPPAALSLGIVQADAVLDAHFIAAKGVEGGEMMQS